MATKEYATNIKAVLNWTYGHGLQVSQFCDLDRSFLFNALSCSHTKEHGHGSVARAGGVPEWIGSMVQAVARMQNMILKDPTWLLNILLDFVCLECYFGFFEGPHHIEII